ncbi:MAG: TonB-dependent receptor, partial [Synergistaceae bacterium]|nr:TonB-dependent receptor [Synergistaceae bacterium]
DKQYDNGVSSIGSFHNTKSEYDSRRIGISLNASAPVGERHFLEFLAEYSDESLGVKGDMLSELGGIDSYDRASWNFNLQDTIALDHAGTFLATPSIRWHSLDGDSQLTWQLALSKELSQKWMIKSTYGTYARSPNLYEMYGDGAYILPPPGGSLNWETGTQFDLGVTWNDTLKSLGSPKVNASLSGFFRESENLIELLMESPRYARYYNVANAEVKGVETDVSFDWEKWNISLAATWIDGVNKTPDDPGSTRYYGMTMPNRPEWSGAARLTRKFSRGSAFVEYQYTGENFADRSEKILYDAQSVFNLGVKYDLSPTTKLTVGVNDVFNDADNLRMHPNGINGPTSMLWYPLEGRSYYMTLDMEL